MKVRSAMIASWVSVIANPVLAVTKVVAGVLGNSYALVADGIESTADVFSSVVVWKAMRVSVKPADEEHPYGHGKAESIAAVFVAVGLLGAAALIAVQSVREIITPHHAPEPFTLAVLLGVVVVKEVLYRYVRRAGDRAGSRSLVGDAWHHRSDAITSAAAFVGILIALVGGEGYETADDWAALFACGLIVYNGINLLRPALDEVMDAAVGEEVVEQVCALSVEVPGVVAIEKVRIRKSGMGLLMDIHVVVNGELTVREGHAIAHAVKQVLTESELPVEDVVVHVEPDDEGRLRAARYRRDEGDVKALKRGGSGDAGDDE
ncbi:MAG: cation transporter [Verrucomicrobia bacterium]|nr:MAG: cation transporter [Verrucomicrobiota bacterium]